jgi:hypothetical protein
MMLKDSHSIKHVVFNSQNFSYFLGCCILIDYFKCVELVRSMKICLTISDEYLLVCSWGEITSPIILALISIWEHIIILCGPNNILSFNCINILTWGRVYQSDISNVTIKVFHKSISILENFKGISISEIISPRNKQVVSFIMSTLMVDVFK